MYIWTKANGIINLTHYPRIDVSERDHAYHIFAFSKPDLVFNDSIRSQISITHFKDKVDADYLYWHLCKAITNSEPIWSPNEVKPLSVLWKEVQRFYTKQTREKSINWTFAEDVELSITDLGELTIRYESKWDRELGTLLKVHKETVEGKLIEVLKEEYGPIQVKWESSRAQPANLVKSEDAPEDLPEPDINEIREALIAYIGYESEVLRLDDFGGDNYIGFDCGYGHYKIWLVAWIHLERNEIAANLMIDEEFKESHFVKLVENRDEIANLFPNETLLCDERSSDKYRIGVEKQSVDWDNRENWHSTFRWLRGNLEKLYWVFHRHETAQAPADRSRR